MRVIYVLIFLFISTFGISQVVVFELPKYYVDDVNEVRFVIEFNQSKEKFRITEYTVNILDYNLQKVVYQGSIQDLDKIVLKEDVESNRIRINFSTCENELDISIKNYAYNMVYMDIMTSFVTLSDWDLQLYKEEIKGIVNDLNDIIEKVNQDEYCLSVPKAYGKFKNLSLNGILIDEKRIVYRMIDTMPSFMGSTSIESMQDEIQNYIFDQVINESYNSSTVALVRFLITKSGKIEDVYVNVSTGKQDELFIKECFEKMPQWKPGSNALGVQNVVVSTIVGLDLGDMDLKIETLLNIDTIYNNHNIIKVQGRVPDKNGIYYVLDEWAQFENGEQALEAYLDNLKEEIIKIDKHISGVISFLFVVEKNGSVGEIIITGTPSLKAGLYLRERLKSMPRWIPGRNKGEVERQFRRRSINFKD